MNFNKLDSQKKLIEFQSTFLLLKENEPKKINIKSSELFENHTRNNMVTWLSFLCDTLNFNIQTLFRSIIIFDKFISSSNICNLEINTNLTQEKLNLIAVACLSLGTKLEEINCNYVSFFTEKVLNLPNCKIFTVKDLTEMELNILKELKFKTLYNTSYDFMAFYFEVFKYYFNPNKQFCDNLKNITENIMKQNIKSDIFLNMTQSEYAFLCLNQAFIQIGMNSIMNQIRNILMFFNINNLIKNNKVSNINNEGNKKNNLLSLPSFEIINKSIH